MAERIQLRVVTPLRPLLDVEAVEVTAPGTLGEFGVLPNHATFLSSLESGRLSYHDGRGRRHLAVRGGFAEVSNNVMTVLAEDAELPEDIDGAKAKADLAAAEVRLARLSQFAPEFAAADADCQWARARLDVAQNRP